MERVKLEHSSNEKEKQLNFVLDCLKTFEKAQKKIGAYDVSHYTKWKKRRRTTLTYKTNTDTYSGSFTLRWFGMSLHFIGFIKMTFFILSFR